MINDKKPSIYDDRGAIGSSDELDKYGVWVKSEPQDLSITGIETVDTSEMSANQFEEMSDLSDDISDDLSDEFSDDDFSIPDMEELPDFDSLEEEMSKNSASSDIRADDTDKDSGEQDNEIFVEVSMNDFLDTIDDTEDIEDAEITLDDDAGEDTIDTVSTTAATPAPAAAVSAESTQSELSTQLLIKIAEELSSIRVELSGLKKEFSVVSAAAPQQEPGDKGFFAEEDDEKISLTGAELINIMNTADFTEETGTDATVEFSENLDLEVEEPSIDVSSLDELESEVTIEDSAGDEILDIALDDFEVSSAEEDAPPEESFADTASDEGEIEISFDTEDPISEDPGSEDFTAEETQTETKTVDTEIEIEIETETEAETVFDIGIDDDLEIELEETELETGELDFDETLESLESFEELPEFAVEESDELKQIREEGAQPMTADVAPEDADYLAQDPLSSSIEIDESEDFVQDENLEVNFDESFAESDLELEMDDFSDAVIDEPDLSSEINENPLEEPSLEDISINLDLSDLESEELVSDVEDESETELPEGFIVEPTDDDFSFDSIEEEAEEITFDEFVEDFSQETSQDVLPEDVPLEMTNETFEIESEEVQEEMPVSLPEEILEEISLEEAPEETFGIADSETVEEIDEKESLDDISIDTSDTSEIIPSPLKEELKTVLAYMDQLLEALPEEKIEEFAQSEYYDTYKKLFKELGLI